jgi:phage terminase large subunit-like protein
MSKAHGYAWELAGEIMQAAIVAALGYLAKDAGVSGAARAILWALVPLWLAAGAVAQGIEPVRPYSYGAGPVESDYQPAPRSVPEMLALLPQEQQDRIIGMLNAEAVARGVWDVNQGGLLRRAQRYPPGSWWTTWLLMAGRGFGKTRVISTVVRSWAMSGVMPTTAIVGTTADDVRRVLIEGDSGIYAVTPRWERPLYRKQDRALQWPNGAMSYLYSAQEPDRFRGANNYGIAVDELAAYPNAQEMYDQMLMTLRRGVNPRMVIATTPRPLELIRKIASDPTTYLTTGSTRDNARNLSRVFLSKTIGRYKDTRLGEQEIEGGILMDTPGAVFPSEKIKYIPTGLSLAQLRRIVVSVDPSGSAKGDDCGIVVVGDFGPGAMPRYVVLADMSLKGSPNEWSRRTVAGFDLWKADLVVAETNFGGDIVVSVLQQSAPNLPVVKIHASRGKVVRAEPVGQAYERGDVVHLRPMPELEQQMTQMSTQHGYMGSGSPDRVDALCHGMNFLMSGAQPAPSYGAGSVASDPARNGNPMPSSLRG